MKFQKEKLEDPIECPVCHHEYCHLTGVELSEQPSTGTIQIGGRRGLALVPDDGEYRRGSVIKIGVFCETGHKFFICFQFHKGMTYVRTEVCDEPVDPTWTSFDELWRF